MCAGTSAGYARPGRRRGKRPETRLYKGCKYYHLPSLNTDSRKKAEKSKKNLFSSCCVITNQSFSDYSYENRSGGHYRWLLPNCKSYHIIIRSTQQYVRRKRIWCAKCFISGIVLCRGSRYPPLPPYCPVWRREAKQDESTFTTEKSDWKKHDLENVFAIVANTGSLMQPYQTLADRHENPAGYNERKRKENSLTKSQTRDTLLSKTM